MRKILFASVDLLKTKISDISYLDHRDSFLSYVDELCDGLFANKIVFICKNINELQVVKTIFKTYFDYPKLHFATCYEVKGYGSSYQFHNLLRNHLRSSASDRVLLRYASKGLHRVSCGG